MRINERIAVLESAFELLKDTPSRNDKEDIITAMLGMYPNIESDWQWILRVLTGRHPLGYTLASYDFGPLRESQIDDVEQVQPLEEYFSFLWHPLKYKDLSESFIESQIRAYTNAELEFIQPIVDRELRLGISKSMMPKDMNACMLAEKYPDTGLPIEFVLQEKLDGIRCITRWDKDLQQWAFTSRNGNAMNMTFNMKGFDKSFVYDGEVLSEDRSSKHFSCTSGLVNSNKVEDKGKLHYWIYDCFNNDLQMSYSERYEELKKQPYSERIHLLPLLELNSNLPAADEVDIWLDKVTEKGGEGIMIRNSNAVYKHERCNDLLKYKKVQTCDLRVIDLMNGTGKNDGKVGALVCEDDDKTVFVRVGSGLSDAQREAWAEKPSLIINKIVEVKYFDISKGKNNDKSSLRHPRFKKVREDKNGTSMY